MKKLAIAVAAAAALASQAEAGVLAFSWEEYTDFGLTGATVVRQVSSGDTSSSYNGAPAATGTSNLVTFGLFTEQGPSSGTVTPLMAYAGAPLDTAGSYANRSGSIFSHTLESAVHNLATATTGDGASSQSNVNSTLGLMIDVGTPGKVKFDFNARNFLRFTMENDALGANTAYAMIVTLQDIIGNTLFAWLPNGGAGGISGGTELLDPFSLNRNVSGIFPNTAGTIINGFGAFSAETDALAAGRYMIGVDLLSSADVQLASEVPEPGSFALAGLALCGVPLARRLKK